MTLKKLTQTLFIVALLFFGSFICYIIYKEIFPDRAYKAGQKLLKIEVIVSEPPAFLFSGLDEPSYYVLKFESFSNDFHISNEVLDLVQDNDSISNSIKEIKYGDSLILDISTSSISKLNQSSANIEIIGLSNKAKILIDPGKIEKYYNEHKLNNRFSIFVMAVILFFIIRKKIKAKRRDVSDVQTDHQHP